MPRLSAVERERALGMLTGGMSHREIARHFQCHHTTIMRLQQRFQQTGVSVDRPRPGQPRVTTPRQDAHIRLQHLRDRFQPAAQTARQTMGRRGPISSDTVRRRLHAAGLQARRPFVGPVLTRRHRQQRLHWAQQHQRWTRRQWRSVLFSDESRFNISHADGRQRVWRRAGERMAPCCIQEVDRWGGGGVMVWAGFSYDHRTPLHFFDANVNADTYRVVLQNQVVPLFRQHPQQQVFQQDNARPHTAHATVHFLQVNNIALMPWPALSPDLAPIEHAWDELGRRVSLRQAPPTTLLELRQALTDEWNRLPQHVFQTLVNSMRRRCNACIAANGGHTRY